VNQTPRRCTWITSPDFDVDFGDVRVSLKVEQSVRPEGEPMQSPLILSEDRRVDRDAEQRQRAPSNASGRRATPAAALPTLDLLVEQPALARSHRVRTVRAELHRRLHEEVVADQDYRRAGDRPVGDAAGVGATYRQVLGGPPGRKIAGDYRVTTYDRPTTLGFEVIAGPLRPTGIFELSPTGSGGTIVTFRLAAAPKGVMRPMAPMIAKQMRAETQSLDILRAELESNGN
jgi:hypothetical protein